LRPDFGTISAARVAFRVVEVEWLDSAYSHLKIRPPFVCNYSSTMTDSKGMSYEWILLEWLNMAFQRAR